MSLDKQAINAKKANDIAEAISTPEGRLILHASTWFPMEIPRSGETKLEWAKRKIAQLEHEISLLDQLDEVE